ncbi:GNAT family N-acetyltransferase [Lentibacillus sp. Marseille-P4043]|uniref:GNAT family N-acetyltransferase n=1 Tax=Lentibacillus sp. Marseille-P4043 TaxID=2040293 RepID=UPI00131A4B9E|nr:GNAT family protein [Lentibacillus sp. Marseille-P4043]
MYKINNNISLKLISLPDVDEIYSLIEESKDHLTKWLPWVDSVVKPEDMESVVKTWIKMYDDNNGFQTVILYNNKIIGSIGLMGIDWRIRQASIGAAWIVREWEGTGMISKSVQKLIKYSFGELNLNRIEICCAVNNFKSQRIPERFDFHQDGIIRDGEYVNDQYHDVAVYSLLKREWYHTKSADELIQSKHNQ